jgi:hypothetical protein
MTFPAMKRALSGNSMAGVGGNLSETNVFAELTADMAWVIWQKLRPS